MWRVASFFLSLALFILLVFATILVAVVFFMSYRWLILSFIEVFKG